jgi:hypothetical protein
MIESGPYGLNEKKKEKISPGQSQKVEETGASWPRGKSLFSL